MKNQNDYPKRTIVTQVHQARYVATSSGVALCDWVPRMASAHRVRQKCVVPARLVVRLAFDLAAQPSHLTPALNHSD